MKDFINPISDKDIYTLYEILDSHITYDQIREYGHYMNYIIYSNQIMQYPKVHARYKLAQKIYQEHLPYVLESFSDEYTRFYTIGQFEKMLSKAIYMFLDNKKSELDVFDEYRGLSQGDNI